MELDVCALAPGTWAEVSRIPGDCAIEKRLREFGFVPGTLFCCRYRSPDKKLWALEFRGTVAAVRLRDLRGMKARVFA